jgi:hypothetical protein
MTKKERGEATKKKGRLVHDKRQQCVHNVERSQRLATKNEPLRYEFQILHYLKGANTLSSFAHLQMLKEKKKSETPNKFILYQKANNKFMI